MPLISAEQFAQRLFDCGLVDSRSLDGLFGELGSRDVPLQELQSLLLQRGLLTNWQMERIEGGHVTGYFYGDYKVLYMVGAGTFARVYRAVHCDTEEVRAVKVLRNRYADDMDTTERFLKEARTVMDLRHPNIVPIYEVESEKGRYYMVMDFIEGQNLRDFVRIHKRINLRKTMTITRDITAGLDYAFHRGVTHRDLKLSNVLLSTSGRACLTDFGLAADDVNPSNLDGVSNPRSIDYAGLERITGVRRDDKRSDIYFLGCMLYHMLSGEAPLFETRERIQRLSVERYRNIKPITMHLPNLPHSVVVLVQRCMELDADARFQTPGEVLKAIDRVIEALDAGETDRYDARLAAAEAERHMKKSKSREEGRSRTVMLIESSVKVQDALRERLKKLGYRVLIFRNPALGLARFEEQGFADAEEEPKPADCVIFGCGDLHFEALDAFNQFGEAAETRMIPAILITGERQEGIVEEAKLAEHRVHMQMPIKFRELRSELRRLIQRTSEESPDPTT